MRYFGGQLNKVTAIQNAFFTSTLKAKEIISKGIIDPFCGTGVIPHAFAGQGKITASDNANFAYYFSAYQLYPYSVQEPMLFPRLLEIEQKLNNRVDKLSQAEFEQSFVENYAREIPYFTEENAVRIARYRELLDISLYCDEITQKEYDVFLGALLSRALTVANIRLLFDGAFHPKDKMTQCLISIPQIVPNEISRNQLSEINLSICDYKETMANCKGGLLYLNPPAREKDYKQYYHVLDTIIEKRTGKIVDKIGRINGYKDSFINSIWAKRSMARSAFYELIMNNRADYIMMSYSKTGIISLEEIEQGLLRNGDNTTFRKVDLGNEMLFLIEKDKNTWGF